MDPNESVFNDPEAVEEQLSLPSVVSYSFVGPSSPAYHARVEAIVTSVAGDENIHARSQVPSRKGNYTAYRYDVFHTVFQDVEQIYKLIGALEGTKFVI